MFYRSDEGGHDENLKISYCRELKKYHTAIVALNLPISAISYHGSLMFEISVVIPRAQVSVSCVYGVPEWRTSTKSTL